MEKRRRRRYSEAFKHEALAMIDEQGYSISEVARRLEVNRSVLTRWRKERAEPTARASDEVATDKEAELRALREEVRKLRMEKDILKKAAAFFAKEQL